MTTKHALHGRLKNLLETRLETPRASTSTKPLIENRERGFQNAQGQIMDAMQTLEVPAGFDLIEYARRHRFRTRNLHDGGLVPPARRKTKSTKTGYVGSEDRADAIVGHRGYLTAEDGGLGICLFFKSGRGVATTKAEIKTLDGRITQEGDHELSAQLPVSALASALKLMRVSKLRPGNENFARHGTASAS